jgi:uncharacterized protein with HEPN domain
MKDRSVYIATALECINLIKDYTSGFTLEIFLADRKTKDAVVRNLEIIGQALNPKYRYDPMPVPPQFIAPHLKR